MKSAPFEYVRPATVAEASAALSDGAAITAAIAGGQSLLPMLNLRVAIVDRLVDISRLEELKAVMATPDGLRIGALTSHAMIEDGEVPDLFDGLMRRVAGQISYRTIRHHGTIGGSVALADPAADWPSCLMALGASVIIGGCNGARSQLVAEFIQGPYSTSLIAGEIIVGFDVPRPDAPLRWGFAKVVRKSGAFANSIAVVARRGRDGPVSVVLAAAGPRACALPEFAKCLQAGVDAEDALRVAIAADLNVHVPDADEYQKRLHTATILRAWREMRTK
jgi:carbon-monoxide dehydrogenase medium subunit